MINSRNNFDLLRLLFASSVFMHHVVVLSREPGLEILRTIFSVQLALNAFFVISGFLVFMSFENSGRVGLYLEKRVRRIYPAYFAVVLLCALFGSFLSSNTFREYFLSGQFIRYIAANTMCLNFFEPGLPGVFQGNPISAVNGSLWTIRNEVLCYVMVPFIILLTRRMNRIVVFVFLYSSASLAYTLLFRYSSQGTGGLLAVIYYVPWHFLCFISGGFLYYYYNMFKEQKIWSMVIALVVYVLGSLTDLAFLKPLSLAVIIVSVACYFPYLGNFARYGDLSYGVYIIHFPVVQVLVSLGMFGGSPVKGLMISMSIVMLLAFISWHVMERPFLKRSSHYITSSKHG